MSVFIVLVDYIAPLEEVDRVLPAHVRFLEENYASGAFLLSGRRVPRTGGIIMARAQSSQALMEILAKDPFHTEGVARYTPLEFSPTMAAEELQCLLAAQA